VRAGKVRLCWPSNLKMTTFYKYHGAGNDFIMIDNRKGSFDVHDIEKIKLLCHRRFGIGADGIITLQNHPEYDFAMTYINNDGSIGAMCGNGGRCIVDFAHNILNIIKDTKKIKFLAVDGEHEAEILEDGNIKLKMQNVASISEKNNLPFLYSGTAPHNIKYVENLQDFPVVIEGRKIRNMDLAGVNVNFVELKNGIFHVRTYERGVEDETLACGTGSTSVAIASHYLGLLKENMCNIQQPGGKLKVEFEKDSNGDYKNIWLTGPAQCICKGELSI
jgi:diaminopimelate epimerase